MTLARTNVADSNLFCSIISARRSSPTNMSSTTGGSLSGTHREKDIPQLIFPLITISRINVVAYGWPCSMISGQDLPPPISPLMAVIITDVGNCTCSVEIVCLAMQQFLAWCRFKHHDLDSESCHNDLDLTLTFDLHHPPGADVERRPVP